MRPVLQIKFLFLIFTIANGQNKIHKSSLKSIEYSVTTEINYAGNMNMAQTLDVYIPKHKKNENSGRKTDQGKLNSLESDSFK